MDDVVWLWEGRGCGAQSGGRWQVLTISFKIRQEEYFQICSLLWDGTLYTVVLFVSNVADHLLLTRLSLSHLHLLKTFPTLYQPCIPSIHSLRYSVNAAQLTKRPIYTLDSQYFVSELNFGIGADGWHRRVQSVHRCHLHPRLPGRLR